MKSCGRPDYKKQLDKELAQIHESEMWRAGTAVRTLRPHEKARMNAATATGVKGRKGN